MKTNFVEWKQRVEYNKQIRDHWFTIKAHVTSKGLRDGLACIDGNAVVWTPNGEPVTATGRHQFTVIDGLVYA